MEKKLIKITEEEFEKIGKPYVCHTATVRTMDQMSSNVDEILDYENARKSMLKKDVYGQAPLFANAYLLSNERKQYNPPCPIIQIQYEVAYMVIPKKEFETMLENREKQKKKVE